MKLNFKICGSGYEVFIDAGDISLGMIDREVDGCFYWSPSHEYWASIPAWILRGIADWIDKLNLAEECNKSAATLTPDRAEKLRATFEIDSGPKSAT